MQLLFERTFAKDVQRLTDRSVKAKGTAVLQNLAQEPDFEGVMTHTPNVKKMQG